MYDPSSPKLHRIFLPKDGFAAVAVLIGDRIRVICDCVALEIGIVQLCTLTNSIVVTFFVVPFLVRTSSYWSRFMLRLENRDAMFLTIGFRSIYMFLSIRQAACVYIFLYSMPIWRKGIIL